MFNRRKMLTGLAGGAAVLAAPGLPRLALGQQRPSLVSGLPSGVYDTAILDALPGKKPLIKLSYRPPNYETPVSYFKTAITPNDAFFVRYHLAVIPEIDAKEWRLKVGGEAAASPFELTLAELQTGFEQVEVTAVCQCSGNRRGLSQPHVPGVEWGLGAMGNAIWRGVRLKDVLAKAGLRKEAVEIVLDGADGPVVGQDARLRQEHPRLEGARRKHDHRASDERRSRCRISTASRRVSSSRAGPRPIG